MLNSNGCKKRALMHVSAFVFTLLLSRSSFAALGQDVASVQSDGARMKVTVNVVPGQAYSIHEMRSAIGTTVREFVSPAGQVFGVSWQGPYMPDLRQLLGEYFDQYLQAAQSGHRAHSTAVHFETGDLVFEAGGHMRFFVGRAYLRSKVPERASADAIR
jgi:hypothetical protein